MMDLTDPLPFVFWPFFPDSLSARGGLGGRGRVRRVAQRHPDGLARQDGRAIGHQREADPAHVGERDGHDHPDLVERDGGGYDVTKPLSPALYAATRSPYTAESPSLNPRGALARMTWTPPPSGNPDDDDMIVVADVYDNGRASLAAVVAPPRNPRALDDLQDAFRKNPAFVPAAFDRRPQTMRVVFVLQKMNVADRNY